MSHCSRDAGLVRADREISDPSFGGATNFTPANDKFATKSITIACGAPAAKIASFTYVNLVETPALPT
ncbi:hypothetical protein [Methylobacterium sp. Leaf123]|uniref:hypothetical protein n=1 Tax=Methylobacterium sp. Leaf123 TaxID=1736264 RepID=UPI0012E8754F|nr:hypothetical protein [Methylobacterium sp. Leaf123]